MNAGGMPPIDLPPDDLKALIAYVENLADEKEIYGPRLVRRFADRPHYARKLGPGFLGENLVHLIPHMLAARRLQIPHRAFHIGMA
jgi:hypothetical protein